MKKQYDVVIIGAGVVGSAIARELSRYKLSIAVLEKNLDVCNETSGRNSAVVHGGFANPIGSLKAKCCVEGNKIMGQLAEELNFPFKRCGKVLVGNTPEDMEQLERTMKQGAVNGCTGLEMIDEAKLHELVPAVVQGGFTRKGRDWAMGRDGWDAAFAAVFRAADEGKLDLPLTGNAYLFEVAMRLADKAESQQERGQEQALRSRTHTSDTSTDIASLATAALQRKDPALAKLDADRAKAALMPAEVREKISQLKRGA